VPTTRAKPLTNEQKAYIEAMLDPEAFFCAAVRLLRGDSGAYYGTQSRGIRDRNRLNREANLGQMIATVVYNCDALRAVDAWRTMTPEQQTAATDALTRAMDVRIAPQKRRSREVW
jgi:hypothetical protein